MATDGDRYRRIPTVIRAVQFWPTQAPWPLNVHERRVTGEYYVWNALHASEIILKPGDMVRIDDPNDTYPIDLETFRKTYEPAD